tara:strand:+ start:188 stop:352 length:165 start_codon:yes stop_codon:yes gene_type:complete
MTTKPTQMLLEELGRLNDEADKCLEEWLGTNDENVGKRLDQVTERRMQIMRELG